MVLPGRILIMNQEMANFLQELTEILAVEAERELEYRQNGGISNGRSL